MKLKYALAAVAALGFVAAAAPSEAAEGTINLCTGPKDGNYDYSGKEIADTTPTTKVNPINTKGSEENVAKLKDGSCDAAIVQEDAIISFQRKSNLPVDTLTDLYPEHLHLVCSKQSGIDELTDLMDSNAKLALGKTGNGAWVTWKNITEAEPRYAGVQTDTIGDKLAVAKVAQNTIQCFLKVSGIGSATLNDIDENYGDKTKLVEVRDGDLSVHVGMSGEPLYQKTTIPEGTYPKWIPSKWVGSNTVKTVGVMAKVVYNTDTVSDDDAANLLTGVERSISTIHTKVGYQPQ